MRALITGRMEAVLHFTARQITIFFISGEKHPRVLRLHFRMRECLLSRLPSSRDLNPFVGAGTPENCSGGMSSGGGAHQQIGLFFSAIQRSTTNPDGLLR